MVSELVRLPASPAGSLLEKQDPPHHQKSSEKTRMRRASDVWSGDSDIWRQPLDPRNLVEARVGDSELVQVLQTVNGIDQQSSMSNCAHRQDPAIDYSSNLSGGTLNISKVSAKGAKIQGKWEPQHHRVLGTHEFHFPSSFPQSIPGGQLPSRPRTLRDANPDNCQSTLPLLPVSPHPRDVAEYGSYSFSSTQRILSLARGESTGPLLVVGGKPHEEASDEKDHIKDREFSQTNYEPCPPILETTVGPFLGTNDDHYDDCQDDLYSTEVQGSVAYGTLISVDIPSPRIERSKYSEDEESEEKDICSDCAGQDQDQPSDDDNDQHSDNGNTQPSDGDDTQPSNDDSE